MERNLGAPPLAGRFGGFAVGGKSGSGSSHDRRIQRRAQGCGHDGTRESAATTEAEAAIGTRPVSAGADGLLA